MDLMSVFIVALFICVCVGVIEKQENLDESRRFSRRFVVILSDAFPFSLTSTKKSCWDALVFRFACSMSRRSILLYCWSS